MGGARRTRAPIHRDSGCVSPGLQYDRPDHHRIGAGTTVRAADSWCDLGHGMANVESASMAAVGRAQESRVVACFGA